MWNVKVLAGMLNVKMLPGMLPGMRRRLKERVRSVRGGAAWWAAARDSRNRVLVIFACLLFLVSLIRYNRGSGALPELRTGVVDEAHNLVVDEAALAQRRLAANCTGRYVYIAKVPRELNEQIVKDCHLLKEWTDMCVALSNAGLGPNIRNSAKIFTAAGWYNTHQFALEAIFHNRMHQYECVTLDASRASAVYVPYFAGLEAQRTLWQADLQVRDRNPARIEAWLRAQPEWAVHQGHDHFMVGGRITWDFRRTGSDWGNNLLTLPGMQNLTTLVIEGSIWDDIDVGIPYPSYFHPSSDADIFEWQKKVRKFIRRHLFSFAGGTRSGLPAQIRPQLIDQCRRSPYCKLLSCDGGACVNPEPVMRLFEMSTFCLQPQGDSATRKSIFDSMLAGCIPVFFHSHSYKGYKWHLPQDPTEYSVCIDEDHIRSGTLSVESVLRAIPDSEVRRMRNRVVDLIPGLVYADPRRPTLQKSIDAFEIAMMGVMGRITDKKQKLAQH